jgi:flagellar basal body rod protein FlgB
VERESLHLAENQLRYQVAVAFLKAEFHRLASAINGGSNS